MKKLLFITLTLIVGSLIFFSCQQTTKVKSDQPIINMADMDTTVNPGDNFYLYANGGWIAKNPIPESYSAYSAFNEIIDRNNDLMKKLIENILEAKNPKKGSPTQQIKDFYSTGMDTNKIEELGITPIKQELEAIAAINSKEAVVEYITEQHHYTNYPAFVLYPNQDKKNSEMVIANLYQGGYGLSDIDYYKSDDAHSKEIRTEYVIHISKMFMLFGVDEAQAEKDAAIVMAFETRLTDSAMSRLEMRNPHKTYNKMTVSELQELAPNINWTKYFASFGLPSEMDINIAMPVFIKNVSVLLADESIETWKTYLKWELINEYASYLSKDIGAQNFAFYGTFLSGREIQRKRWKKVLSATNQTLGQAVGKLYVEQNFPPEAKERMVKLVSNVKLAYREHMKAVDWMAEETRQKAITKLDSMNLKVGYPDKWRDYSSLVITPDSYLENIKNAYRFDFDYNMSYVNKPVDRDKWMLNPQTVNAYYSPLLNEIVFPAAILQPPFFDLNADDAVNYGSIAVVIGHEMTHGFDDQGRQYDIHGNLNDWWTEQDAKLFKEKTDVLVNQFNNYTILDSLHVDGELTLGENIADLAGVSLALDAFKKTKQGQSNAELEGFSVFQRFFISYGRVWRQNIRDKTLIRRLKEDVHSPNEARINGLVYNIEDFYKAFNINETSPRYIAPDKRAKVW